MDVVVAISEYFAVLRTVTGQAACSRMFLDDGVDGIPVTTPVPLHKFEYYFSLRER